MTKPTFAGKATNFYQEFGISDERNAILCTQAEKISNDWRDGLLTPEDPVLRPARMIEAICDICISENEIAFCCFCFGRQYQDMVHFKQMQEAIKNN